MITRHHAQLLRESGPGPQGACAFLDADGGCRIYAHRPYVCRTQGLPLRWGAARPNGTTTEQRDICELNEDVDLMAISADSCWTLGPVEQRLAAAQRMASGVPDDTPAGDLPRIALRDLFQVDPDTADAPVTR